MKGQQWGREGPPVWLAAAGKEKPCTGRESTWGPPVERGLPSQVPLSMKGRDANASQRSEEHEGSWRAALGGSTKHMAGKTTNWRRQALLRWGEHRKQEGSHAPLHPDPEREEAKSPEQLTRILAFFLLFSPLRDHSVYLSADHLTQPQIREDHSNIMEKERGSNGSLVLIGGKR